tara:strand:- start:309 stop:1259 length:951 start_codon:yes stop_codon:yes gene_type:complete
MAAARASHYLSQNNNALQKSLERLSSGKRINQPADDAGGLAVSMKLSGTISRLNGTEKNIANAISFLQVQDGILESAGKIVSRMGELKGLYGDVLKNATDKATYDAEFQDLQGQLFQIAQTQFNGVSLFGTDANGNNGTSTPNIKIGLGDFDDVNLGTSNRTVSVFTTADGSSGASVSISQTLLLSALTFDGAAGTNNVIFSNREQAVAGVVGLADKSGTSTDSLASFDTNLFAKALENVATLRANNGGQVSRLQYAQENVTAQKTNLEAANGRIMDVDIAMESTNLAKQNLLVQASASMVAQATLINDVALMLLR